MSFRVKSVPAAEEKSNSEGELKTFRVRGRVVVHMLPSRTTPVLGKQ